MTTRRFIAAAPGTMSSTPPPAFKKTIHIYSLDKANKDTISIRNIPRRRVPAVPPQPVLDIRNGVVYNDDQDTGDDDVATGALPAAWDWRQQAGRRLQHPVNQRGCGSCWAISTTTMLRDRLNIFFDPQRYPQRGHMVPVPELSYQYLLSCASGCIHFEGVHGCNGGCGGGFIAAGLAFLNTIGTPAERRPGNIEEAYIPQQTFQNNKSDGGPSMCPKGAIKCTRTGTGATPSTCPGVPEVVYKSDVYYRVNLYDTFAQLNMNVESVVMSDSEKERNMINIMREIHQRGPVVALINLYSDFDDFWKRGDQDDVYQVGWRTMGATERTALFGTADAEQLGSSKWTAHNPGPNRLTFRELHSVVIVGWGTSPKAPYYPYWIVRNSWGVDGQLSGYFRIRRGHNALGIESDVMGCWFAPERTSPETHNVRGKGSWTPGNVQLSDTPLSAQHEWAVALGATAATVCVFLVVIGAVVLSRAEL